MKKRNRIRQRGRSKDAVLMHRVIKKIKRYGKGRTRSGLMAQTFKSDNLPVGAFAALMAKAKS